MNEPTDRNPSFLTCVVFSLEAFQRVLLYSVIINSLIHFQSLNYRSLLQQRHHFKDLNKLEAALRANKQVTSLTENYV